MPSDVTAGAAATRRRAAGTAARRPPRTALRGRGFALLAVLPFAAFLAVFAVYPLVEVVRMSVADVRFEAGQFLWSFSGLDNYAKLADDPIAVAAARNTVVFTVTTVLITVVAGTGLAVLVDRAVLLVGVARNVLLWPAVVAPVVVSVIWLLILSPSIGVLNKALEDLGLDRQGWIGEPAGAMLAIILVDVWHWTPVVFLLVYTALRGLDQGVLGAARVDGASEWQLLWHVVLPQLRSAMVAAALIRLVMGVKAFDEMFLLTRGGPGNSTTLVSLHIRTVFFDRLELGYGAAFSVAVVLAVVAGLLLTIVVRRIRQGVTV